jgi:hypothetical protein
MAQHAGRHPSASDGWEQIASFDGWKVYTKAQDHSCEWLTCKVAADGKVQNKANYWFTKNTKTGQFGFCRDLALMQNHRPELHQYIKGLWQ